MVDLPFSDPATGAVPIAVVRRGEYEAWLGGQRPAASRWLEASGFNPDPGQFALLPDEAGGLEQVVAVVADVADCWSLAGLPLALPVGTYQLGNVGDEGEAFALGWGLGSYQFTRYRAARREPARLVLDPDWPGAALRSRVAAIWRGRDLINTGPEDLMPEQLADLLRGLASEHGGTFTEVVGDELLTSNFPMIHAVGRASRHAPRLLHLSWGDADGARVALVGKGVCFDSGGLDLKPAAGMRQMKKDMGGAAVAICVAEMIMRIGLPIRIDLIVAAVENAVSDSAFHPGDVLPTRKGITVEIDNTDAEGRLVLGDALTLAMERGNQLVIDFATLTGAARVAVGTEVPAFFADQDELAEGLSRAGHASGEPIWRLPLHRPYRTQLNSKVADIVNGASQPYGGAITAALFLAEFVDPEVEWAHFDLMGFNQRGRPGRPEGGEPHAALLVEHYLRQRFG